MFWVFECAKQLVVSYYAKYFEILTGFVRLRRFQYIEKSNLVYVGIVHVILIVLCDVVVLRRHVMSAMSKPCPCAVYAVCFARTLTCHI